MRWPGCRSPIPSSPSPWPRPRRSRPGLVVATPAGVAGQVLDRREVPVPAGRQELLAGGGAGGLRHPGVPGGAHADRLREQRRLERVAEPVDGVDTVDDGNVQAGIVDRELLDRVVLLGPAL